MLISWSRGRSGQLQKCTFSLPKWVQSTHRAPHSPPECRISSKYQCFRYSIKYLAFRWGIGGFELNELFIGTVSGDFGVGTTNMFALFLVMKLTQQGAWFAACLWIFACTKYCLYHFCCIVCSTALWIDKGALHFPLCQDHGLLLSPPQVGDCHGRGYVGGASWPSFSIGFESCSMKRHDWRCTYLGTH